MRRTRYFCADTVVAALSWFVLGAINTATSGGGEPSLHFYIYELAHSDTASLLGAIERSLPSVRAIVDTRRNGLWIMASPDEHEAVQAIVREWENRARDDTAPQPVEKAFPEIDEKLQEMDEAEMRRLVLRLWKQVDQLERRVRQLEEETSFRIMPLR